MWLRVLLIGGLLLLALVGFLNPKVVQPPHSTDGAAPSSNSLFDVTDRMVSRGIPNVSPSVQRIGYTHINAHFHSLPSSIATREKDLAGKVEEVKKIAAEAGAGEVEVKSLSYTLDTGQNATNFKLQGNITFRIQHVDKLQAVVEALKKKGFTANESGWCG